MGDDGACTCAGASANRDRGDQQGITANEGTGTDACGMFGGAIVVASNGASADVDTSGNGCIAKIAEMANMDARANLAAVNFGANPQKGAGFDDRAPSNDGKGADMHTIGQPGLIDMATQDTAARTEPGAA